jgi:hypothetical protein
VARLTPFSSASSSGPSGISASQSRRARAHESASGARRSAPSNPSARDALGTSDTRRLTTSAGPPAGERPGGGAEPTPIAGSRPLNATGGEPPAPSRQRSEAWLPHWPVFRCPRLAGLRVQRGDTWGTLPLARE